MRKLSELMEQKRLAEALIVSLNREISSHPDEVKKFFGGCSHSLFEKVSFVEYIEGYTSSRKNTCGFAGFKFIYNGKTYYTKHGSNWCSSFNYCGEDEDGFDNTLPYWEDRFAEDEPLEESIERMVGDGIADYKVVGLVLLFVNHIIG